MPYRVIFHIAASSAIPGLPAEAGRALFETLTRIRRDPHSAGSSDPDDPAHRHAVFGGSGVLAYRINEEAEFVHVYQITWAG
ncbi:hypothetical protein [Planobispora rosea]|uniref:hypothetical protein n=1 Tax=Planobispora rosea TaxID=35762 RepID=UPI00083B1FC9|nr:hypothetical protein [Planobispora rosea]